MSPVGSKLSSLPVKDDVVIEFIGSGSGLVEYHENYHSNALIHKNGKILAIDCGSSFQPALWDAKIKASQINALYVSHLHADHCGGIESLVFKRYFSTFPFGQNMPKLFGNRIVLEMLWNNTLSGGLKSVQGLTNKLENYFDVKYIVPNGEFDWDGINFQLIQTVHVIDDRELMPSYGLLFNVNGTKVFFTTDTQFCPNSIETFYNKSDIIFHDCELANYRGSVHAQYHQLCTLPENIKEKMWLYHYSGEKPKDVNEMKFRGFVNKRDKFVFDANGSCDRISEEIKGE